jgi:hypothetical protein
MSGDAPPRRTALAGRSGVIVAVVSTVAVAVAVVWWWWPNFRPGTTEADLRSGSADVVVVADGQVAEAADEVARRIREYGRSVVDAGGASSWCDAERVLPSLVERHRPGVVVVSIRDETSDCDDFAKPETPGWARLAGAVAPARLIVVVQPGPPGIGQPGVTRAALYALGASSSVILADPTPLLGEEAQERLPCQWWDDCAADGLVTVRVAGLLTTAGGERFARTIAAVLP